MTIRLEPVASSATCCTKQSLHVQMSLSPGTKLGPHKIQSSLRRWWHG